MVDTLVGLILLFDFVISIWNSYAAGFQLGLLQVSNGPGWVRWSAFLGLAIGIIGETYVLAITLGLLANAYGLVSADTVNLLLAYNSLVAGGLITVLGVGIAAESVYIAATRPGGWTIGSSVYNVFASIWNVFNYMRNFGVAMSLIKEEEREGRGRGAVVILAVVAVFIAILLSYIAFHYGRAHASGEYRGRVKDEDL